MGEAFRGAGGPSPQLTYTVPRDHSLRLELLTFTVVCDGTAGIHKARLTIADDSLGQTTGVLRDLNEGGAGETLVYTYGIGLNGSACVTVTGWEMTDALPDTELAPSTTLTLAMVNDTGVNIPGDTFSGVALFGTLSDAVDTASSALVPLVPGLLPAGT